MVVIVFGLPGSGKSYFARRLAARINAEYINSDITRKEILEKKMYSEQEKVAVYYQMIERVVATLKHNRSVVVDATFYKKGIRARFTEGVTIKNPIMFIEILADEELVRERLKTRRWDSDADFEVYKKIKEQWEPMQEPHLVLQSTNDSVEQMLEIAVDYIYKNDKGTD
jgi:predicted kinase